jgi:hypothetical protein
VLDRFERFKTGEKVEALLEEAEKVRAARVTNPKTRR